VSDNLLNRLTSPNSVVQGMGEIAGIASSVQRILLVANVYRCCKPVASSTYVQDVARLTFVIIESFSKCRDVDFEVAFIDESIRPDLRHEVFFAYQVASAAY
jgi:hypothetical protein